MKLRKYWEKYENCIMIILTIIVNVVLMSIYYDFYYDLNDDVLMKDIMAGVYTGTPDGHNMQTLYILGAFISLWYRLCRNFPWYGLFLFLCQTCSAYLIGVRLLRFCKKRTAKAGCLILLTVFLWGILLFHMVIVQYTVTCALMAATAVFLFMTTEKGLDARTFVIRNIPSILLVILAYQLRTEMLLLVFPLICLAGLFRWMEEEIFFQKADFLKYGLVFGCILTGMLISRSIDFAAYGSEDWKTFLVFFDKRTEIYDYHYDILTNGEHSEYLASIGLSDAQQELLANYNFGLDEDIDEEVLDKIAAYASGIMPETASAGNFVKQLSEEGKKYCYRILHSEDRPYNILMLGGYASVAVIGVCAALKDKKEKKREKKCWSFVWELALLGFVRTLLWMFLLMRGRVPERITHSLYLVEIMVLLGMLCIQYTRLQSGVRIAAVLLGICCICNLPHSVTTVSADMERREEANRGSAAIAEYCKAHPENFYFEDVYSTVGFSQKIFQNVDNSLTNYDIMGGWICKSPLYREKLERFNITETEEGLLTNDSVYFIMETGTPDSSTDWMQAYYAEKGRPVRIEQTDLIADNYAVYRVIEE